MKQMRASLYFSRRKDKDIIEELNFSNLEKGDINWAIKELMRDGIKYRKGKISPVKESPVYYTPPIQDTFNDFDDIEITKKDLDESEINERLEFI